MAPYPYLERNKRMITKINQSMKSIANRICCGYRTVSLDAASLLAWLPLVSLLAGCRKRAYERIQDLHKNGEYTKRDANAIKKEENLLLLRQWEIYLRKSTYGTRTISAILPSFNQWLDRRHGILEFHVTQIMTGHGCLGVYLNRI